MKEEQNSCWQNVG